MTSEDWVITYPIECNNESNREGRVKCGSTLGTVGSSILCWHPIHLREREVVVRFTINHVCHGAMVVQP